MNTKPNMIVGRIVLTAALAFATSAFAQTPSVGNSASQTVHYKDLNLSTTQGVQTLYRRIWSAALAECEQIAAAPDYVFRSCARSAADAAVHDVNNSALTAMHNQTKPSLVIAAR